MPEHNYCAFLGSCQLNVFAKTALCEQYDELRCWVHLVQINAMYATLNS